MIGSIIKYTAVAAVGAVLFCVAAFSADETAINVVKDELRCQELKLKGNPSLSKEQIDEQMRQFVKANLPRWNQMVVMAQSRDAIYEVICAYE